MAVFCEMQEDLKELSLLYPHYLVGEAPAKSSETVRSWIVDVITKAGEILLRRPEEEGQGKDRAMTVEQLYESIMSLSPGDYDPVELSLFEGELVSMHVGIVGARLLDEEEVLVLLVYDGGDE